MTTEVFQILASTPPADIPHDTRANEIAQLPLFLSGTREREDGTDYVVTSEVYRDAAGNAGRIYFQRDSDNAIVAIQSKVGGEWTNWKITADSIADDAVTAVKIPDKSVPGYKLADDAAGDGIKFVDTTVGDVTTRAIAVTTDDTSIEVDETTKKLRIKENASGVSLYNPKITWHALFNEGQSNEFQVGSNTEGDYSQCYLNAVKGIPINLYVMPTATTALGFYQFGAEQVLFSQKGSQLLIKLDASGNVFYETPSGAAQNVVWKNSRIAGGQAMLLEASEGKLIVPKLNLSALPTAATGLSSGDVWNDGGTLKVV